MKNLLRGMAFALTGVFIFAATSYGASITFDDLMLEQGDSYPFSIGSQPAAEQLAMQTTESRTLQIFVKDDQNDGPEQAWVYVEGDRIGGAWVIPSSSSESYVWEIDVDEYFGPTLEVEILMKKGDLILQSATLTDQATHTPIPSTILLFSVGLIGLAGIKRRFKK